MFPWSRWWNLRRSPILFQISMPACLKAVTSWSMSHRIRRCLDQQVCLKISDVNKNLSCSLIIITKHKYLSIFQLCHWFAIDSSTALSLFADYCMQDIFLPVGSTARAALMSPPLATNRSIHWATMILWFTHCPYSYCRLLMHKQHLMPPCRFVIWEFVHLLLIVLLVGVTMALQLGYLVGLQCIYHRFASGVGSDLLFHSCHLFYLLFSENS